MGLLFFIFQACSVRKDNPNVILFIVDDLGWQDTSVPFWDDINQLNTFSTPGMEKLAERGMLFTEAYAYGSCSPSRISLITGMNATRHRVTSWVRYKNQKNPAEMSDSLLVYPMWNVNGLNPLGPAEHSVFATPLPQLLAKAGYQTIHVGKAHFGAHETVGADPMSLGFQINIGGHAAGAPGSYYAYDRYGEDLVEWAVPGLQHYYADSLFLTEALTAEALNQLENALEEEKPFFLHMSHYAVHTPIQPDPRYVTKYLECGMDSVEASYASLVEGMDKSLGDIIDFLEQNEILENTLLIFISDNGGLCNSPPRGGLKFTHNYPLACGKATPYEGGLRIPMIASWPGKIPSGARNRSTIHIQDLFTTILNIAGIDKSATYQTIDGRDLSDIILNNFEDSSGSLVWNYPNHNGMERGEQCRWGPYSAIRKGYWKLIYFHADQSFELYDLANDISEQTNLALTNPAVCRELAEELTLQLMEMDAQLPTVRLTGEKIPFPIEAIERSNNFSNNQKTLQ